MSEKRKNTLQAKTILSGSILETFFYKHTPEYTSNRTPEENRMFSLWRARTALKRLVNTNAGNWFDYERNRYYLPQFFTLTFKENVTRIEDANYQFTNFWQRMNRTVFKKKQDNLKYSAVIEFQKRGAVHYHTVLYNFPYLENYTKILRSTWGWGRIDISSIENIGDIGQYLTKYMIKGFEDERLHGKKRYFNSRGLYKPIVYKDDTTDENMLMLDILSLVPQNSLFAEYETDLLIWRAHYVGNTILRILPSRKRELKKEDTLVLAQLKKEDTSRQGWLFDKFPFEGKVGRGGKRKTP